VRGGLTVASGVVATVVSVASVAVEVDVEKSVTATVLDVVPVAGSVLNVLLVVAGTTVASTDVAAGAMV